MQRLSNICGASSLRIIQQSSTVTPRLCLSSRFIPRPTTSLCRAFSRPMSSMFPGFVTEKMDRQQVAEQTVKNAIEKTTPLAVTNEQRWAIRSEEALKEAKKNPPANAYTGRTVTVKDDLAMAYKSLDIILSRNKVRQTLRMEERHEKKGVKRRRLSSQRWRKRFADEVRKKVQLVKKIRDRGA